jgi:predicted amidohydrolase YtcJ
MEVVSPQHESPKATPADLLVINAKVTTLDEQRPDAEALAVLDGKVVAVGKDADILRLKGEKTRIINAAGRRVIPGLNDSHGHYLRGGTSFTSELRWDGVSTLKMALEMIRRQALVTPKGQWVRVVGGFTPYQFEEKRLPTPEELTDAAPNTPVYIQYFYSVIILNKLGVAEAGLTKDTPEPVGGKIERDADGHPSGNVFATPNPAIFYSLLGKLPRFDEATAENSTQWMFHELARYGLTSVIDAGGGGFNYPDNYSASITVMKAAKLPLRVSFYLFTQHPGKELEDYENWMKDNHPGQNLDELREHGYELEGGGEWVLWKAGDFENFRSPRPTPDSDMEEKLEPVLAQFVANKWPFRIHATYDESISRILNVIEKVNARMPLNGLRWVIDHAETMRPENMRRIKALGGGVAVQDRMYFLGDDFIERYGALEASHAPPVRLLLDNKVPLGMGTDATRSSFNPWLGLYFLTTGRVASGRAFLAPQNRLSREEALNIYSLGSAWFSQEENAKGRLKAGQYADFALLSKDYMTVPAEEIKTIQSLLTVVGGKIVFGDGPFAELSPTLPPVPPEWSPLRSFKSFYQADEGLIPKR